MQIYQLVVTAEELQLLLSALDTALPKEAALRAVLEAQRAENDRYSAKPKHGRHLKTA